MDIAEILKELWENRGATIAPHDGGEHLSMEHLTNGFWVAESGGYVIPPRLVTEELIEYFIGVNNLTSNKQPYRYLGLWIDENGLVSVDSVQWFEEDKYAEAYAFAKLHDQRAIWSIKDKSVEWV